MDLRGREPQSGWRFFLHKENQSRREGMYSLQCKNSCDTISKRNFLTENKDGTVKKGNCT